jgi:4-diphosphocytidyl-2-C-methyl-D-erythritol kinase
VSGFLRIRAHAKVNLALAVGAPIPEGKPRAGMHPIASWMVAIDLADEVEIRAAERATFEIEWASGAPIEWEPRDDLAVRAHAEMERAVGHRLPARIRVRKHIPAGGGLGGGSADAGAVLRGLDAMFKLRLPEPELHAIASRLGSDVPFFVDPGVDVDRPPRPALVTGLGGTIERTPATSGDVTLFFPSFGCPTGAVYAAFDEALSRMTNARTKSGAAEPRRITFAGRRADSRMRRASVRARHPRWSIRERQRTRDPRPLIDLAARTSDRCGVTRWCGL